MTPASPPRCISWSSSWRISRKAEERQYYPVPYFSHPQDVSSCQSSPNPRENWDSLVCKHSQVLCCSFRSLFIATKLQKEFDNESVFPVYFEKSL